MLKENSDGLCEAEVKKNLVLAEIGEPLTIPLSVLNRNCEFKKEWLKIQNKWHGVPENYKETRREYRRRPEVKTKYKAYRQQPEVKARRKIQREKPEVKARKKEYDQRPEVRVKREEYRQTPEVKAIKKAYDQRPEIKAKRKERIKILKKKRESKDVKRNTRS